MANKWFNGFGIFSREDTEVKALKGRLDAALGEREDMSLYDSKFYDAEPSSFSGNGMYQIAGIDQTVNTEQLQRLYATETWVYVPVNAIAKTVASLPSKLQRRQKINKQTVNAITGKTETIQQDNWIDANGSDLADVFAYPNEFTTRAEFFMMLVIDLMTAGQYYIYLDSDQDLTTITTSDLIESDDPKTPFGRLRQIMADGKTPIKAMYRIPPSLVKPVPSEDNLSIVGYALHAAAGTYAYNPAEIIHVKLPNPTSPLEGLSPLIPVMKPLLLDRFSTEHMIRFYKSGARLGGVIKSGKDMTKEQLGRFQRSFENNFTGRQNHHRTLILPPGMEYTPVETNPAEMALLEFCKYNREAILAAYNVPPIKAGIMDKANYANALVQLKQFFTDTVIPVLTFIEDGFNLKNTLMPDQKQFRFKFDLSDVEALKDTYKEKAEAAKLMISAGLTVNEVRARVWDAAPIKDGDKCVVIEDMNDKIAQPGGGLFGASAPREGVEGKDEGPEVNPEQGILAGMPGPMVTQIMNIIGRVSRGRLSSDAAMHLMHTVHGVPTHICERLLGVEAKPEPTQGDPAVVPGSASPDEKDAVTPAPQPDSAAVSSDIVDSAATLTERVQQLVAVYMQRDKLTLGQAVAQAMAVAQAEGRTDPGPVDKDGAPAGNGAVAAPAFIPTGMAHDPGQPKKPCEHCKKEPCECPPGKGGNRPSLEQYVQEALSKLDPNEPVTEEFLKELRALYVETHGEEVTNKEGEVQQTAQVTAFGSTKEERAQILKNFLEKTDPMIAKRHTEVLKFFHGFKAIVMGKIGANLKAYGLHKVRTKADEDEILSEKDFGALIEKYIAEVDGALLEAAKYGFADTLVNFQFSDPDPKAVEALKNYLAGKIKGVTETTVDQMRDVLSTAFAANKPIAEVAKAVSEKFEEISTGRAQTIARTETLTAVSIGREQKRAEFKEQFPDQELEKGWVSAGDDHVRDSHADLDGTFIDADDTFDNGCKYPRDPDGEAEEVINCRCTDVTRVKGDENAVEKKPASEESDDSDQE